MGGAERQSLILARSLEEEFGAHVDFLGWGGDGILADEVRQLGMQPWVFPHRLVQNQIKKTVSLYRLAKFIRTRIRPHYLLPFVSDHSKVIGSIWRKTGARFTWWNQRDEGRGIYGTRAEARLIRKLPSIVSNSYEGRDFLVKTFSLPSSRIQIINNGIVLPEIVEGSNWRSELGLTQDDILITMIANITRFKDHETLLRAFSIVRRSEVGQRCKLMLAGRHGEKAKDVKALAFDLGLGRSVQMPGSVEDVSGLLSASDLVVHSSATEGCPNAVLEAMAHAKCVVGTDISGLRQALGDNAADTLLAPISDHQILAQKIVQLAKSPAQRKEIGEKNRKRIESNFGITRMTQEVLQNIVEHRV